LLVLYQIDESSDETADESGDDTKDSVPQGKAHYAGTFPLQWLVTYIMLAHKSICDQDQEFCLV